MSTLAQEGVTFTLLEPGTTTMFAPGNDVSVLEFSAVSIFDAELRFWPFHVQTTGLSADDAFLDMKVWDADLNAVITDFVNIRDFTTPANIGYTNLMLLRKNESRRFRVTVDPVQNLDDGDSITVSLLPFVQEGWIWNMETGAAVPPSHIYPIAGLQGATRMVVVPRLDIQLAASPSSTTVVPGTRDVPFLGLVLHAYGADIRLQGLRLSGTGVRGIFNPGKIHGVRLFHEGLPMSSRVELDGDLAASFTNLSLVVSQESGAHVMLAGDVSATANNGDQYAFFLNAANSTDVEAVYTSSNGGPANATISGVAANTSLLITVSIGAADELGGISPPPPPVTRWEKFEFPRNEWTFFAPVGEPFDSEFPPSNRWGWNVETQGWARDRYQGTGMVAKAEDELEGAVGSLSVTLLTTERLEEEVRLFPGWNLIGFTRFPDLENPQETGLWNIPRLDAGVIQAAVWSPILERYLRVGVRADGMYWYSDDWRLPEYLLRPGSGFFVFYAGQEPTLFNPNGGFQFKGAPSLNLNNSGGADDGNTIPPPPLPGRPDPRGKKLETWGQLKRR
ncbi:MAG: hypothetical protein HY460_01290 [Parcubacteria group bacterium]|nr:hypothetical protein [Parcubacteria group bacterium]